MTQRDRHTPVDGGPVAVSPPVADAIPPDVWEACPGRAFAGETIDEVETTPVPNGTPALTTPLGANGKPRPNLAQALLNGPFPPLPSLRPPVLALPTSHLDPAQRDAVARALATTDICLIQGHAGSGKTRVVVEILRRAVTRGDRVLFLAMSSPALDQVLEMLGAEKPIRPIRCLGPEERAEDLLPSARNLTLGEQVRQFQENTLASARRAIAMGKVEAEARDREGPLWARLEDLAGRHQLLAVKLGDLEKQLKSACDLEAELSAPSTEYATRRTEIDHRESETLARLEDRIRAVRTEMAKAHAEHQANEAALRRLNLFAEARREFRFWSLAWWQSLAQGNIEAQNNQLTQNQMDLGTVLAGLEGEATKLLQAETFANRQFSREKAACREAEKGRERCTLEQEIARLHCERDRLDQAWQAVASQLRPASPVPVDRTPEGVKEAVTSWHQQRHKAALEQAMVERSLLEAEHSAERLPGRLAAQANLVAVPVSALITDPQFKGAGPASFDLVVVEGADQIAEVEFQALTHHADRWVLVGAADLADDSPGRTKATSRPALFHNLWRRLHTDPRHLPSGWLLREGRLVARLRRSVSGQDRFIQTEKVVDRPDVELSIVAPPGESPWVAEVSFPPSMPPCAAKEFLWRELEQVAFQTDSPAARWEEEPDRVVFRLAPIPDPDAVPVLLAPGVRERIGCWRRAAPGQLPWQSCCIEFDRAAGWDRAQAEGWLLEQVQWFDSARTAYLPLCHRAQPELAILLRDLLPSRVGIPATPEWLDSSPFVEPTNAPALTFLAIPRQSVASDERRVETQAPRRQGGTATMARVRPARGGAGLEIDLAEPRRHDLLPVELRGQLPRQGLVNYLEAQAVVRALEKLAGDAGFQKECSAWRHENRASPAVQVIALYPAQAQLLTRLIANCPALVASPTTIAVGTPWDFRHGECLVSLISLTRSHTHRAVTFGDGPDDLALVMTRAARRIFLVGDPGTLIRRCQWDGPLDHLGDEAARRERDFFVRLLGYLQGHGRYPHLFHLEGCGP